MTSKHLTFEEHKKLGEVLKPIGDDLTYLHVIIANRNGKTSREAKAIDKLDAAFSHFKSEMEEAMFRDCKNESKADTSIYYGERISTDRFSFLKE